MRCGPAGLFLLALLPAAAWSAARHPEAEIALDVTSAPRPGFVPEAAPPRFVLLDEGRVFVGGTRGLAQGQLEKPALKELDEQVARVR